MSWVSLFFALGFLLVAIHVTSLPSSPPDLSTVAPHDSYAAHASIAAAAAEGIAGCREDESACKTLLLAGFVSGMSHRAADRLTVPPQHPADTLARQGGDPEALALLLATLLDYQRIPAYLVFSWPDAYVLACGIPPEAIEHVIRRDRSHSPPIDRGSGQGEPGAVTNVTNFLTFQVADEPCVLLDPSSERGLATLPSLAASVRHGISLDGRRLAVTYLRPTEAAEKPEHVTLPEGHS